jgi:PAS domain S-box-containing protein
MRITGGKKLIEPSIRLRQWSKFLNGLVFVLGVLVLLGWAFDIDIFKHASPGLVAMNPATAVCFILSALSLFMLAEGDKASRKKKLGTTLAFIVLATGILKLVSLILGIDIPIDSSLFHSKLEVDIVGNVTNRMAPNTAFGFVLVGISLLFLNQQTSKFRTPSQYLALIMGALGILSVLGYLYQVQAFYGFMAYIPMAIHTATCFLLLALAILFTHPEKGIMAEFSGNQAGAIIAQKLIPAAIIIPVILGFFKVYLTWKGLITDEMGISILVLGNMIIFLALIMLIARELNRKDALKKKAENALRNSLKDISDYKHALDESSILVITDQDGIIRQVNDNFCKITQYKREELIEQDHRIINAGYHTKEFIRDLWITINNGGVWKGEIKNIAKDGSYFWLDTTIVPFMNEQGRPYQFVAIRSDITQRKELEEEIIRFNQDLQKRVEEKTKEVIEKEEQYRFLLQNMREGIQVISYDWRYLFVNNSVVEQSKYSKEVLVGHTMMEKYPGIENTKMFEALQRCMEKRKPEILENEFTFPGGRKEWYELSIQPVPEGLFILSMDITERKKAEEQLREYAEELKGSNTELERFAYVASHDLQEPLRMVSSFLTLLENRIEDNLDETSKQYIHFAVDGAGRMKTLIHDLLMYSRIGTNKEDFTIVDLNEVMQYITRVLEENIKETATTITVKPLPVIRANKTLISQLLVNLLSNSLKYHGENNPEIEVGYNEDPGNWIFYVKDNGIGIDPKFFDKIFIIFQRLHNKSEYSGTGIGLAICKKIVEIHKGKVWIESELSKGSTFYFSIPKQTI